ncbi:VWA domain-containing protein [Actinoplanes sp. L3-i22]|uniref:vWA domain-containing protein n=1 Tax=Actinoplanes sp. L3-i22 TaxID=2836373 RepID=UPI0021085B6A|nr:VWA domain-containing protein [Actinoplanes sp. L3-i22]
MDRAAFAVAFVARCRRAGLSAGLTETDDLIRGLGVVPAGSRAEIYWVARVTLVRREADLAAFEGVFAAVFDDAVPLPLTRESAPGARREDEVQLPLPGATARGSADGGLPWAMLPTPVAARDEVGGEEPAVPEMRPEALAALAERPFDELDSAQLDALAGALAAELHHWPHRRGRRRAVDARGPRISLRHTVAQSRRTAFEPVTLVRERPVRRPRRAVLLCDVSASMRAQTAAYLHLMRAFTTVTAAEVFAFATTLTRLTPALRRPSAREAIERASSAATDRFGGTRIASNLVALLDSHHGDTVRGALVLIASDGWDSDPPEQMTAAMSRLRRRAHRVVWLNPRAGTHGFAPAVAGMSAALPFCDLMLPAATFGDLTTAVRATLAL